MRKKIFQAVMVSANQLIKDVGGIGGLTASGKEFTELVKKVRDLAVLVHTIASELQRQLK